MSAGWTWCCTVCFKKWCIILQENGVPCWDEWMHSLFVTSMMCLCVISVLSVRVWRGLCTMIRLSHQSWIKLIWSRSCCTSSLDIALPRFDWYYGWAYMHRVLVFFLILYNFHTKYIDRNCINCRLATEGSVCQHSVLCSNVRHSSS